VEDDGVRSGRGLCLRLHCLCVELRAAEERESRGQSECENGARRKRI